MAIMRFKVIQVTKIGQIFGVDREVSLFSELVRGESLNSKLRNLASRHYSVVWCEAYFDILNRLGVNYE